MIGEKCIDLLFFKSCIILYCFFWFFVSFKKEYEITTFKNQYIILYVYSELNSNIINSLSDRKLFL